MSISNFEYKKMSVTCLGPVHITDEVGTVYSYQYLYDAGSRRVYFLNERLWVKFLYKHNLLAEFEELIKTRLRAGTLCEWVQEKGFKTEDLGDAVTDYANVEVAPEILAANKMRLTEIVRTVHNVEGRRKYWLPIKCALRKLCAPCTMLKDSLTYRAAVLRARCVQGCCSACCCRKTSCVMLPGPKSAVLLMTTGCAIKILPLPGLRRSWKLCCCTV